MQNKILYITRKFPPSVGGMQRFNHKLVYHINKFTNLALIKWGGNQIILPAFVIYAFLKSIFIIATETINCVYVADGLLAPLGWLLKKMTGKKVVVTIHGRDIAYSFPFYQTIISWSLKRLDKIVCVSTELKHECKKRGISEEKIEVIPNGVDIKDFWISEERGKILSELEEHFEQNWQDKKILLTVGRLVAKKGIDSFLENILPKVIEKEPNIIYIIVGDGPLKKKIRKIARRKNLTNKIFLTGQVLMEDKLLKKIYCIADLFIMPNVPVSGDKEGFGIVALEAGAAGLPIVASKVDGITEAIINEENGFLVNSWEYNKFAHTILILLGQPDRRYQFGKKAKKYVLENFNWEKISKQYITIMTK